MEDFVYAPSGVAEGRYLVTVVAPSRREGSSPTGLVGRRLARLLRASGGGVRVLAEPGQDGDWPAGVEVVTGSVTRPEECAGVLDGVGAVFLAGAHPASVRDVLASARDAGVRKVVLLSSHGSEYEAAYPPETWHWLAVERAVEGAGLLWTHLRPSAVMGAALEGGYPAAGSDWPASVRAEGVVREALLDRGHYPFIHEEDLAAVACAALTRDDHAGTVLEAVGLPLGTRSRIRSIAAALGRELTAVELTAAEGRAAWKRDGWPDGAVDVTLYALEQYADHYAELVDWTLAQRPSVRSVIGRAPLTFDDWVREHVAAFR